VDRPAAAGGFEADLPWDKMPVNATKLLRSMRGGAQAQLLEAGDGHWYVTKYINNPQHRRILVNEWIGAHLLRELKICVPETRVVELPEELLAAEPGIRIQLANTTIRVPPGWHFGSRFPGNPLKDAVYDYLPDTLLESVVNRHHFGGALVFDKWTCNADARQSIFFRRRVRDWLEAEAAGPAHKGFIAQMVDNGYIFDGPNWTFNDAPRQGLYFRPAVYRGIRGFSGLEPWLTRAMELPARVLDQALRSLPVRWLDGDETGLERLLEALYRRRKQIPELIAAVAKAHPAALPDWK
jgi:hypothetical protein